MAKISVIVPVYKAEKDLVRCAESVLAQDFADLELLLVDDGSPDRSGEICDELAAKDARVGVIHQPNAGVSAARNRGIEAATGVYFCFLDADDELLPGALSAMAAAADAGADLVIGGMQTTTVHLQRNEISVLKKISRPEISLEKEDFPKKLHTLWRTDNLLSVWAKLYRAKIIREQKIRFDSALVVLEDYDFVLSYLPHCRKIVSSPAFVYHYYQERGGIPYYAKRSRMDYADDVIHAYEKQKTLMAQLSLEEGEDHWFLWKDLFGNFGTAFSALWAIPTEGIREKINKCKRIRDVLKTPAYRAYVAFSGGQYTKSERFYMKHPTTTGIFLLRRIRAKLEK